jgi:hypothetical protein
VLDPLDQILHCAVHLFHDVELRDRLRDLVDLDGLMRHFSAAQPNFWPALLARAQELGLTEPLALACHFTQAWPATPVPAEAARAIRAAGPGAPRRAWLLPLLSRVLMPHEPEQLPPWAQGAAAQVLLLRHHRNRMPLALLVPHLLHKARKQKAKNAEQLIADTPSDD